MGFRNPRTALVAFVIVAIASYLYWSAFRPAQQHDATPPANAAGQTGECTTEPPQAEDKTTRDKLPPP